MVNKNAERRDQKQLRNVVSGLGRVSAIHVRKKRPTKKERVNKNQLTKVIKTIQ